MFIWIIIVLYLDYNFFEAYKARELDNMTDTYVVYRFFLAGIVDYAKHVWAGFKLFNK